MNAQDIISSGLLELYAAGIASSEEKVQVENWIKQDPDVEKELNAIYSGLEDYALANAVAPGADVKNKIFAAINSSTTTKNKISEINDTVQAKILPIKSNWKWAAAASVALLIGSTVMNVIFYDKYNTTALNLKETEQELAAVQQRSNDLKTDMDVVHNPYSIPVSLKGQQEMPEATAKIFWMQNTGAVMIDASNLPDAPTGKQYQFWAIVDGKPVDGGLIITNDKGKKFRMQPMKAFGRAEAFAISLEKEGGNPTPTKVVSLGKTI